MRKYIRVLTAVIVCVSIVRADEREPDRFEQAIIAHDTIVAGSVTNVNETSKSEIEVTGTVTIQIQEKLQGDFDSATLQLPFEYVDPGFRTKFARTGWARVLPKRGQHVVVAFSCNIRKECDATAVLDLDAPGEAKWFDAIRQALTLTAGVSTDKGKKKLLQALSSDNSLVREVSHGTLLNSCKSEWCRSEMVDTEIASTRIPDTIRQSEALNQLSEIYDRLEPGSIQRKNILRRWFGMISDKEHGSYAIELMYTKLADPLNKTVSAVADLGRFSVQEKKSFISVLNALPKRSGRDQEAQSLLELLRKSIKGSGTREKDGSKADRYAHVKG